MIGTNEYVEKVYAGVLGKIIGVYLGRPFEGWTYERITEHLGEIWYYVHEKLGKKLVVVDDDISGTFAFLRALDDHAEKGIAITSADIGNTWLNYLIEEESILWWGGKGISTEHTAYLRLKEGYIPPESGSIALNGSTVAEQIGAQIFIEGWGLISPQNPELAVKLAGEAGRVSHDGESVIAAQMVAAMVSLAFDGYQRGGQRGGQRGSQHAGNAISLVEHASRFIDQNSLTMKIIDDLLNQRAKEDDWRAVRNHIATHYGYDKYGGGCHIVPNHAVDLLGILYSEDNFQRGLMITNTAGWDTDCNSANVGCILGLMGGLEGIDDGADFRGPVADKMYVTTADGGSVITDAVQETYKIVNTARRLAGLASSDLDKGARFNFSLPGSMQGFEVDGQCDVPTELANVEVDRRRGLRISYTNLGPTAPIIVRTHTFIPKDDLSVENYSLSACPTLYPGQTIRALVSGLSGGPVSVRLCVQTYNTNAGSIEYVTHHGDEKLLNSGDDQELEFVVPLTSGAPIATVGIEISKPADQSKGGTGGSLLLDQVSWAGSPSAVLCGVDVVDGTCSERAWVFSADKKWIHNGTLVLTKHWESGFAVQGTKAWARHRIRAVIKPRLFDGGGIVVGFNGLRRYVSCELTNDNQLVIATDFDGIRTVLNSAPCKFIWNQDLSIDVKFNGADLTVCTDSGVELSTDAIPSTLQAGAAGLIVSRGSMQCSFFEIGEL